MFVLVLGCESWVQLELYIWFFQFLAFDYSKAVECGKTHSYLTELYRPFARVDVAG